MIKRLLRRVILWALHDPLEDRRMHMLAMINDRRRKVQAATPSSQNSGRPHDRGRASR